VTLGTSNFDFGNTNRLTLGTSCVRLWEHQAFFQSKAKQSKAKQSNCWYSGPNIGLYAKQSKANNKLLPKWPWPWVATMYWYALFQAMFHHEDTQHTHKHTHIITSQYACAWPSVPPSFSSKDTTQKVCLSFQPNGEEQEHDIFCDSMKRIKPHVGAVNRSKRAIKDYLLG
jgi:hypothetical protein